MCLKVIDNLCAIFWHCRYSPNSDGTLVISGLKSEDSGVYTCTASSPHQLEQRQLQLKVQGLFQLKILRVISCSHQQVAVQYPHWLHEEVLLFQGRELVQLVNPWLFYYKWMLMYLLSVFMLLSSGPEDHHSSKQCPGVWGQHSCSALCGVRRQHQHRLVQVKIEIF